jgi:4-diphosphocytidyl-2-C-methyl-D-erythritol kinase
VVIFPNAKINLGLRILHKRGDGFHDVETGFYPIPLCDALEFLPSTTGFAFQQTGRVLDVEANENICVKAWNLLKARFPGLPDQQIHLHKAIPSGAGLGGGSSDAAHLLQALDKKYQLFSNPDELAELALQLGSDCPFFLLNKPAIGTGRGEHLMPVGISLKGYLLLLINPGIHISTAWAFSKIQPGTPAKTIEIVLQQPISSWPRELINDFEKPVYEAYPAIQGIRDWLYEKGASYASLSGTGSTVYGIFKEGSIPDAESYFPSSYSLFSTRL